MTHSFIRGPEHLFKNRNLGGFGLLNTVVLGAYLAGMLAIGIALAGRQRSTEDYFLGGATDALAGGGDEYVRLADQCDNSPGCPWLCL